VASRRDFQSVNRRLSVEYILASVSLPTNSRTGALTPSCNAIGLTFQNVSTLYSYHLRISEISFLKNPAITFLSSSTSKETDRHTNTSQNITAVAEVL